MPSASRLVALPPATRAGSTSLLVLSRPANDAKPNGVLDRTSQCNQVPQRCLSLSGSTGISRQSLSWDPFASFGSLSCKGSAVGSSCHIPHWTTGCLKAAATTDRVNTRLSECSSAACFNASLSWSFVSETLAASSYTGTHEKSSGGHHMRSRHGLANCNVDTQNYKKVALDPYRCPKRAAQLVARPSESIACDGLMCIRLDKR